MSGSVCMPATLGLAGPCFRVVTTTTCESCDPHEPTTNRETYVMAPAATATGHLATALKEHGSVRRYRRGEALFSEGDIADRVFMLESGWVIVRSAAIDGDDVVLGLRGPGEILGELSVLDGKPRSATAIAVADL